MFLHIKVPKNFCALVARISSFIWSQIFQNIAGNKFKMTKNLQIRDVPRGSWLGGGRSKIYRLKKNLPYRRKFLSYWRNFFVISKKIFVVSKKFLLYQKTYQLYIIFFSKFAWFLLFWTYFQLYFGKSGFKWKKKSLRRRRKNLFGTFIWKNIFL